MLNIRIISLFSCLHVIDTFQFNCHFSNLEVICANATSFSPLDTARCSKIDISPVRIVTGRSAVALMQRLLKYERDLNK